MTGWPEYDPGDHTGPGGCVRFLSRVFSRPRAMHFLEGLIGLIMLTLAALLFRLVVA